MPRRPLTFFRPTERPGKKREKKTSKPFEGPAQAGVLGETGHFLGSSSASLQRWHLGVHDAPGDAQASGRDLQNVVFQFAFQLTHIILTFGSRMWSSPSLLKQQGSHVKILQHQYCAKSNSQHRPKAHLMTKHRAIEWRRSVVVSNALEALRNRKMSRKPWQVMQIEPLQVPKT